MWQSREHSAPAAFPCQLGTNARFPRKFLFSICYIILYYIILYYIILYYIILFILLFVTIYCGVKLPTGIYFFISHHWKKSLPTPWWRNEQVSLGSASERADALRPAAVQSPRHGKRGTFLLINLITECKEHTGDGIRAWNNAAFGISTRYFAWRDNCTGELPAAKSRGKLTSLSSKLFNLKHGSDYAHDALSRTVLYLGYKRKPLQT